jgi:predicted O-methyltransferase YrrM
MDWEGKYRENPKADVGAMARVIHSYKTWGYDILLGDPDCLPTRLVRNGRLVNASWAISLSDILVFQWIAGFAPWQRALIIGNSFGFSTLLIAGLCPGCYVDAIDAEIEGSENRLGSDLTMAIAKKQFPGVRLTIGFSPQDLPKACRFAAYDFVFIDGLHTNEQLIADFSGVNGRREKNSVVYLHDIGMAKMTSAWSSIKSQYLTENDAAFDLHFTSFGSTLVISGHPELKGFMRNCSRPIQECFYYSGSRHIGFRSAFHMLLRTIRYSSNLGRSLRWPKFRSKLRGVN